MLSAIMMICILLSLPVFELQVNADYEETNEYTGYERIVDDEADLLTDMEEQQLMTAMKPITQYGNVAFKSVDYNYNSSADYAESYYRDHFGTDSGTVFLIDMDNRNIWIFSDGLIYKTINRDYADTITDNVYTYASDSNYYRCAAEAFDQMNTLLEGRKIAQPMKYICNLLFAFLMSLLIFYLVVRNYAKAHAPSKTELMGTIFAQCNITNPSVQMTNQIKTYNPHTSSSGGSGGGGGGGGSSGGGGGHSF